MDIHVYTVYSMLGQETGVN